MKLARHLPEYVENSLREKGRNNRLQDWQFRQIIEALRILFTKMVHVPWFRSFPWEDWQSQADSLPNGHATVVRDYQSIDVESIAKELLDESKSQSFKRVYEQYPEYIFELIKHICLNDYSIRTERAYLAWFLRYVLFHSMKDPSSLTEDDIGCYLEYLVIKRKLASSTQAQALNAIIFFYKQVLEKELSDNINFVRSKKPRRLPVVLSRDEIKRLFSLRRSQTILAQIKFVVIMCTKAVYNAMLKKRRIRQALQKS